VLRQAGKSIKVAVTGFHVTVPIFDGPFSNVSAQFNAIRVLLILLLISGDLTLFQALVNAEHTFTSSSPVENKRHTNAGQLLTSNSPTRTTIPPPPPALVVPGLPRIRGAAKHFREYPLRRRLLENPKRRKELAVKIDRKTFVEELKRVGRIRNDVIHFDPDGLSPKT
jgi:hypothetical protein